MGPASRRMPRVFVYTERTVDGMGNYCTKERDQLCHRRGGFTLMELMVYIAILGIVVLVAGQAYSGSARSRIRTQSMLKASEVAENVASIFKTDVAQTGAKSSMESGGADGGDNFSEVNVNVYMDSENDDLSSFDITQDEDYSNLKVRRIRYDEQGHFEAVEEVNWFVEEGTLKRSCTVLDVRDGAESSDECTSSTVTVDIAENVGQFIVSAATPSASVGSEQVFPPCSGGSCSDEFRLVSRSGEEGFVNLKTSNSGVENQGGTIVDVSNFYSNYDISKNGGGIASKTDWKVNQVFAIKNETTAGSWKTLCSSYGKIPLEQDQEYELSFDVPYISDPINYFVPSMDHMSVGFRDIDTGNKLLDQAKKQVLVDDFLFFPPMSASGSGKRTVRFSVKESKANACIAFTFACFSPLVSQGTVSISDLKLTKVASSNYKFAGEVPKADRRNVKALKLDLKILQNGESGTVSLIVPIPSNGPSD